MSLVQVSQLSKSFRGVPVVDDLSFTVEEGDIYGFLGQNGAGKSTTIRMLLTLVAPSSGEISLFGMNLRQHRKNILRQVGAVIEKPDLYKYLSGYENLSLFARMSGASLTGKDLMRQLEMVGLAERARDKVHTYSQGMKQRLGIAVALVHDPRLIILDEPANGLDPQGMADMRNLILQLSRHRKTLIVSSHLLSEISQMATRVLIIDRGRKIVEGEMTSLVDPAKSLVEVEVDDPGEAAARIRSSRWAERLQQVQGGCLLFRLPKQQIPELNRFFVEEQIAVYSIRSRNSLETYFLSLTGSRQHVVPPAD
jgi:ABC-type multidrug transport system ATPase subunit